MPELDPELVAHTLHVDPEATLVTQPTRIFHIEIKWQIVKEVQKLLAPSSPFRTRASCLT